MNVKERIRNTYRPYFYCFDDVVRYQFISKGLLYLVIMIIESLSLLLLKTTGKVAITTGDFAFIFKSWQGPILILIALATLFIYLAFDINTQIIFAKKVLTNQEYSIRSIMKEGLLSIRQFFNVGGFILILYITLIIPMIGFGISVSLTENFYIPTFISSVIRSEPLYNVIYTLAIGVLSIIGVINIFILHGMILDNMPVLKSSRQSLNLLKENWKDFLIQNLIFAARVALVNIVAIMMLMIPAVIVYILPLDKSVSRYMLIMIFLAALVIMPMINSVFTTFYFIRLTQLYYDYKHEENCFKVLKGQKRVPIIIIQIILVSSVWLGIAYIINQKFDELVPAESSVRVIAHRGGGSEAPENTVAGINKAIELGAYGSEIDVQRTADNYYIVNHDSNFKRLCGESKSPEEMKLSEIRQLKITDPLFPDQVEKIATFEEMLEAAKGKIVLFVELKGNSADKQMVDDVVRIIKEHEMEKECVIISLKYNLIDYLEDTYPDMESAYLTFASFGKTAELHCDYLGLEEEAASRQAIRAAHKQNKGVLVWTLNKEETQRYFLLTNADFIITDKVSQAMDLIDEIAKRSDLERLSEWLIE